MWIYKNKEIYSTEDMPDNAMGFIYEITFTDGSKYIGKKNLYSERTLAPLKSGKPREGHICFTFRIKNKHKVDYEVVKIESDWKKYKGSHKDCKNKEPMIKKILAFAYNKLELTYLEAKALFVYEVLEKSEYINDNILGSFYRSNLHVGSTNSSQSNTS
jgi:hypothetical protein